MISVTQTSYTTSTNPVAPSAFRGAGPAHARTSGLEQAARRFDFSNMTLDEMDEAHSYLMTSGQITAEESLDLSVTLTLARGGRAEALGSTSPGGWYRSLGEQQAYMRAGGRNDEADRLHNVMTILQRFEGKPWGVDAMA